MIRVIGLSIIGVALVALAIWYANVKRASALYNLIFDKKGERELRRQYESDKLENIFPDEVDMSQVEERLNELGERENFIKFCKAMICKIYAYRHWDYGEPWPDWIKPEDRKVNWMRY